MNRLAAILFAGVLGISVVASAVAAPNPPDKSKGKSAGKTKSKVVTTKSGLKYEDLVVGKGPSPKPGQTVVVHYTGWLTNGKKFDSSKDRRAVRVPDRAGARDQRLGRRRHEHEGGRQA